MASIHSQAGLYFCIKLKFAFSFRGSMFLMRKVKVQSSIFFNYTCKKSSNNLRNTGQNSTSIENSSLGNEVSTLTKVNDT